MIVVGIEENGTIDFIRSYYYLYAGLADIQDGSKFKPKNVLDELKKKSIKYSREVFSEI